MNDSISMEGNPGQLERRAERAVSSRPASETGFWARLAAWRYAETSKRDLRLDLLRGFAAFVMIADHIGGNSLLWPLTGGDSFFVSAAEVFVLISGLLLGIVYARVVIRNGLGSAIRKAAGRAWKLYMLTVSMTLAFAIAAGVLSLWWSPALTAVEVPAFVFEVVTLQRTLFLTDIMLMYTLLVAAAVPVLILVARGYTPVVLGFPGGSGWAGRLPPATPPSAGKLKTTACSSCRPGR